MRLFLFTLTLLGVVTAQGAEAAPRPAAPDEFALFKDAMNNSKQDTEHWAYTETMTFRDQAGRIDSEQVVSFDPSRPYAEQYTPLKIDGKAPTERQLKKYRRQGVKRGEELARKAKRGANGEAQLRINDGKAALDLDHPLVVGEADGRVVFEISLLDRGGDLPLDKFQILVHVGHKSRQIETAVLRIRQAFRMKLVAKVKAGEATLVFTVVDPSFGPVVTSMSGNIGASILFIPLQATFANTRTDWRRVQAYDERFGVKLAPLQFPGF